MTRSGRKRPRRRGHPRARPPPERVRGTCTGSDWSRGARDRRRAQMRGTALKTVATERSGRHPLRECTPSPARRRHGSPPAGCATRPRRERRRRRSRPRPSSLWRGRPASRRDDVRRLTTRHPLGHRGSAPSDGRRRRRGNRPCLRSTAAGLRSVRCAAPRWCRAGPRRGRRPAAGPPAPCPATRPARRPR